MLHLFIVIFKWGDLYWYFDSIMDTFYTFLKKWNFRTNLKRSSKGLFRCVLKSQFFQKFLEQVHYKIKVPVSISYPNLSPTTDSKYFKNVRDLRWALRALSPGSLQNRSNFTRDADLDCYRRFALLEANFSSRRANVALSCSHAFRIFAVAGDNNFIFCFPVWISL